LFTKGAFFFVVYPDSGKACLNFGRDEHQIDANAVETKKMMDKRVDFPLLYAQDLINAFELGRTVERGEAKEWVEESEGF